MGRRLIGEKGPTSCGTQSVAPRDSDAGEMAYLRFIDDMSGKKLQPADRKLIERKAIQPERQIRIPDGGGTRGQREYRLECAPKIRVGRGKQLNLCHTGNRADQRAAEAKSGAG